MMKEELDSLIRQTLKLGPKKGTKAKLDTNTGFRSSYFTRGQMEKIIAARERGVTWRQIYNALSDPVPDNLQAFIQIIRYHMKRTKK